MGLTLSDLDNLHYGEVLDLFIEQSNDYADIAEANDGESKSDGAAVRWATQADMDLFARG